MWGPRAESCCRPCQSSLGGGSLLGYWRGRVRAVLPSLLRQCPARVPHGNTGLPWGKASGTICCPSAEQCISRVGVTARPLPGGSLWLQNSSETLGFEPVHGAGTPSHDRADPRSLQVRGTVLRGHGQVGTSRLNRRAVAVSRRPLAAWMWGD